MAGYPGLDLILGTFGSLLEVRHQLQGSPNLFTLMVFSLLLGMEHALDADHVMAVSTIVSESRNLLRSSLIGIFWGIGHTLTLLFIGLGAILFKLTLPQWVALSAEFLVGLVLIVLGSQILWEYEKKRLHAHPHHHSDGAHMHVHSHEATEAHTHKHEGPTVRKPLLVGMVHGLAGSAALMLLVLSTIRSPVVGILYILVFGLGSVGGMLLISTLIGLPFRFTAERCQRLHGGARVLAGLLSIALGCSISFKIGFTKGLVSLPH